MGLSEIVSIITVVGNILLAALVLARDHKKKLHWYLALISLLLSFWLITEYVAKMDGPYRLLWNKIAFIGPILLPMALLFFVLEFTGRSRERTSKILRAVAVLITVFLLVCLPTNLIADRLAPFYNNSGQMIGQRLFKGPVYYVFASYLLVGLSVDITLIVRAYKKARGVFKQQLLFILLGSTLAVIWALIFGVILVIINGYFHYDKLSTFAGLIVVGIYTYAIVRHRLFDIRLFAARLVAYIFSFGLLVVGYILSVVAIGKLLPVNWRFISDTPYFYITAALVFAVTLPRIKRFFDRITNKIFYQDAYDPQIFMDELNQIVVSDVRIEPLLQRSAEVIAKNLKVNFALFALKDTDNLPQQVIGTMHKEFRQADVDEVRLITPTLGRDVIVTDELEVEQAKLKHNLGKYDVGVLARLATEARQGEEGLGYIVLGYKKSGNPYNDQDVRMLTIIRGVLAIAIQNAIQLEEIQQFNVTLQKKVKEATHALERTNKKLVEVDEAKDEFISMASHQLRTPLTSIKGFLSMMLDGDFGKVPNPQEKPLKDMFVSSQRMGFLISDFLNVSRLKTGKFVIEPSLINLSEIVTQEMERLQEMAKSRDVEITYQAPKGFPKVMLDENKIRQVMMNFIDNAIYYTKQGGKVEIRLYTTSKDVIYKVVDNGIGVPKAEQHRLFTKFFRAKNAQKARPDGTGLGIFMAQKVIVGQGGNVIFESVENKGSTFGFSFPLSKVKPNA